MTPFVHTPTFTASHPDVAKDTANGPAASTDHNGSSDSNASGLATTGTPSHTAVNGQVVRPTLHLPASKQGVTRRTWPFLGMPSH